MQKKANVELLKKLLAPSLIGAGIGSFGGLAANRMFRDKEKRKGKLKEDLLRGGALGLLGGAGVGAANELLGGALGDIKKDTAPKPIPPQDKIHPFVRKNPVISTILDIDDAWALPAAGVGLGTMSEIRNARAAKDAVKDLGVPDFEETKNMADDFDKYRQSLDELKTKGFDVDSQTANKTIEALEKRIKQLGTVNNLNRLKMQEQGLREQLQAMQSVGEKVDPKKAQYLQNKLNQIVSEIQTTSEQSVLESEIIKQIERQKELLQGKKTLETNDLNALINKLQIAASPVLKDLASVADEGVQRIVRATGNTSSPFFQNPNISSFLENEILSNRKFFENSLGDLDNNKIREYISHINAIPSNQIDSMAKALTSSLQTRTFGGNALRGLVNFGRRARKPVTYGLGGLLASTGLDATLRHLVADRPSEEELSRYRQAMEQIANK